MSVRPEEVERITRVLHSEGIDPTWGRVSKVVSYMEHGNMSLEGACRVVANEVFEYYRNAGCIN
jgi:hypothetical protein